MNDSHTPWTSFRGPVKVGVTITLAGARIANVAQVLAEIDGVSAVLPGEDEPG